VLRFSRRPRDDLMSSRKSERHSRRFLKRKSFIRRNWRKAATMGAAQRRAGPTPHSLVFPRAMHDNGQWRLAPRGRFGALTRAAKADVGYRPPRPSRTKNRKIAELWTSGPVRRA